MRNLANTIKPASVGDEPVGGWITCDSVTPNHSFIGMGTSNEVKPPISFIVAPASTKEDSGSSVCMPPAATIGKPLKYGDLFALRLCGDNNSGPTASACVGKPFLGGNWLSLRPQILSVNQQIRENDHRMQFHEPDPFAHDGLRLIPEDISNFGQPVRQGDVFRISPVWATGAGPITPGSSQPLVACVCGLPGDCVNSNCFWVERGDVQPGPRTITLPVSYQAPTLPYCPRERTEYSMDTVQFQFYSPDGSIGCEGDDNGGNNGGNNNGGNNNGGNNNGGNNNGGNNGGNNGDNNGDDGNSKKIKAAVVAILIVTVVAAIGVGLFIFASSRRHHPPVHVSQGTPFPTLASAPIPSTASTVAAASTASTTGAPPVAATNLPSSTTNVASTQPTQNLPH